MMTSGTLFPDLEPGTMQPISVPALLFAGQGLNRF
jgi:hypothetical protein